MITTGLVLSLKWGACGQELARLLARHNAFFPGAPQGAWLPVAMEAADDAESRRLHDWIAAQPGVAYVDVVHVHFGDPAAVDSESAATPPPPIYAHDPAP